ncbi:MAG: phenylalanine--tRNA ligase beta subunit [Candidatus Hydrogenedentota bacterium]
MQISVNWLKELVDFSGSIDDLAGRLTMLGLEVEGIHSPGQEIEQVRIGKILEIKPHPDADKLVVCQTDVGESNPLQIVCGAKNMKPGDIVPTAVVGAKLPGGFEIGRRKMRGIESQGMMCSARELGLGDDHDGLLILDDSFAVGSDAVPLLGLDDTVIEIEITPNRGDWAGMIGIARDLAAYYKLPLKTPTVQLKEVGKQADVLSSVTVECPELCPRYLGRVMSDVVVAKSPLWMVQRLIAAGQRPINVVVDITNYVLLETGHPLHAFDFQKLDEQRIVVRRSRAGEILKSIDSVDRTLDGEMLVIADGKNPVAIAGVMGGLDSEVTAKTKEVFLESAVFDPRSIRRTARSLSMQTEASQRFQRGADPEMAVFALDRAAMCLEQLAGATLAKGRLDAHSVPRKEVKVSLRFRRANALLGCDIDTATQKGILSRLGFEIANETHETVDVRVPSWRQDISREADLIEEVARVYGFERLPVAMPRVRPSEQIFAPMERELEQLRLELKGLGLTEMIAMSFSSREEVAKAGLSGGFEEMLTLQNPMSEAQATLRSSLIPGLLAAASLNVRRGRDTIRLFEIGPVYRPAKNQELPDEPRMLGIALAGSRVAQHWHSAMQLVDFYDAKGILEAILGVRGIELGFERNEIIRTFEPGQSASIQLGKKCVGIMGAVNRAIAETYDISGDLFLVELDLSETLAKQLKHKSFDSISAHPASVRDMAILVDADQPAGDVLFDARNSGEPFLQDARIFDIYVGEQVPDGKKSIALELTFQAKDRTLTDKETQKFWNGIFNKLQSSYQAELR